jgi:hypothetical protein
MRANMIRTYYKAIAIISIAALLQLPRASLACDPMIVSAVAFVQDASPNTVGFGGTVVFVTQKKKTKEGVTLLITLKTDKWYAGKPQEIVTVRGFHSAPPTTPNPCPGFSDFYVDVGTHLYVFGTVEDGIVLPEKYVTAEPLPPVIFSYAK